MGVVSQGCGGRTLSMGTLPAINFSVDFEFTPPIQSLVVLPMYRC